MKIENILKKFWRTVKPLSEGLDRITCFMDNVPVTSTVEVCNLCRGLSVELTGMLIGPSRFSPLRLVERTGMGILSWTWAGRTGGYLNICIGIFVHTFLYVVGGKSLLNVSFRKLLLISSECHPFR